MGCIFREKRCPISGTEDEIRVRSFFSRRGIRISLRETVFTPEEHVCTMKIQIKNRRWAFSPQIFSRIFLSAALAGGVAFLGCHSSTVTAQSAAQQDEGPDPADANMAPVSGDSSAQAAQAPATQPQTQPAQGQTQQAPPPSSGIQNESVQRAQEYERTGQQAGAPSPDQQQQQQQAQQQQQQGAYDDSQVSPDEESAYDELEADQPPPELPTYDQPPAPEPNYIWTPGYWGYAPAGYYWVPGVWVAAPWPGALWTPGYWVFLGGHYRFHRGYWCRYIGFYGGINYGWGYPGYGFYGGYWRGNSFFYNRAVTHINVTRITNVYSRTVVINRNYINNTRISYNGGRGGLQIRPRPTEIAARREPRLPPMQTQLQIRQQAMQNRQQFFNANRGRPAIAAAPRPIQADRGVMRPIARPGQAGRPGQPQIRPGQPQIQPNRPEIRPGQQPGRPQVQPARPQPNVRPTQPQLRPTPPQQARPEVRQGQPNVRPVQPTRPEPNVRPTPQQQYRPTPQPRPQSAPQPQYRPTPQAAPRPEVRPMPRPMPQQAPRPMPQPRPAPMPHGGGAPGGHGGGGHGR